MSAPSILLSAGEASGDLHGAALARALRGRWPGARLWGLGGPRMKAEGVELMAGLDRLAVMGFAEVVRHLPFFAGLLARLRRALDGSRPDLVIPIDYPGLNMRLARAARGRGVPVLYYIAPQVWAWKWRRARELARTASRVAVILPFEADILERAGAHAEFVGHPLLEDRPPAPPREDFCAALGLDPARPVLAILPGSRGQEIARHLGPFLEAARLVADASGAAPVLARAPGIEAGALAHAGVPVTADAWALLEHARAALVKSGTGTLQAAVAGTPMVVAYRTSPLTYALARRLVRVPWVSLVNLVAGAPVVPELLQDDADPEALAAELDPLVRDGPRRADMLAGLDRVRAALRGPTGAGPSERVAELAAALLADGAGGAGG